jgi:hypothetical protein
MRLLLLLALLAASAASAQVDPAHTDSVTLGHKRSPLLAAGLSYLAPGGGHLYNGEIGKAGRFAVGEFVALGMGTVGLLLYAHNHPQVLVPFALLFEDFEDQPTDGDGIALTLWIVGGTAFGVLKVWSVVDAYRSSQRINRSLDERRMALGSVRVDASPAWIAGRPGVSARLTF